MGRAALWGLLIGTALMTTLLMVVVSPSSAPEGQTATRVLASLIASGLVGVLLGGVPGSLVGLVVGAAKRRPKPALPPPPVPAPVPLPVPANDRWAAMVGRCELSVRRVGAAVATVPASPAREWLERIAAQFRGELPDVRRIAELGRALGADQDHPVSQRLTAAVRDFTAFEDEVGRVALRMFQQPSLDAARVHLEVLEEQLPHLGGQPGPERS